jgi:hypothetical protein
MKDWIKKNGLEYKLILESERVHLYEINDGTSYEVNQLVEQKKDSLVRKAGWYLSSNEAFGSFGNRSRVFYNEDSATKYYNELNKEIRDERK